MIGTLINVGTVLLGGTLGLLLGSRLKARLKETVVAGIGLFTMVYGISLFLKTENSLIVLGSVLIGVLLGEWWKIEDGLNHLGVWLEAKFNRNHAGETNDQFIKGFVTASLVFCIGPMAILGSIQDGLTGSYDTLVIKSILDGFSAMAFASSLGAGVLFSSAMILLYQGSITLLAGQLQALATTSMMNELSATGGVLLVAIAVSSLLEIKKIRTGSFLPALIIAPLIVWILSLVH